MKKKVLSIIAIAVASAFACLALVGCGSKTIKVGESYEEKIGAGTKITTTIEQGSTKIENSYYINAKLYTFEVTEKGTYSVKPGALDAIGGVTGKYVARTMLLKADDAKGLSASLIINAAKDSAKL